MSESEPEPTTPEGLPGIPLYGNNDGSFVFRYLLDEYYPLFPDEMDSYMGEPIETDENEFPDQKNYYYGGYDPGKYEINGGPLRMVFNWVNNPAAMEQSSPDMIGLFLAASPDVSYNLMGFYVGMPYAEMLAHIDELMALEGAETRLTEQDTNNAMVTGSTYINHHLTLVFPQHGLEYQIIIGIDTATDEGVRGLDMLGRRTDTSLPTGYWPDY